MALVRLAWKCNYHAELSILVTERTPGFSLNHHFELRNGAPRSSCTGPFFCTCGLLPLVEHPESAWKKQGGCIQALWARIWKAWGWFYSLPWESLNSYNETTLPTTSSTTRQLWLVILHLPSIVDVHVVLQTSKSRYLEFLFSFLLIKTNPFLNKKLGTHFVRSYHEVLMVILIWIWVLPLIFNAAVAAFDSK
jgi:hypothetical protein